ncbi:unnamed protein product, partial [Linum tenue]
MLLPFAAFFLLIHERIGGMQRATLQFRQIPGPSTIPQFPLPFPATVRLLRRGLLLIHGRIGGMPQTCRSSRIRKRIGGVIRVSVTLSLKPREPLIRRAPFTLHR